LNSEHVAIVFPVPEASFVLVYFEIMLHGLVK